MKLLKLIDRALTKLLGSKRQLFVSFILFFAAFVGNVKATGWDDPINEDYIGCCRFMGESTCPDYCSDHLGVDYMAGYGTDIHAMGPGYAVIFYPSATGFGGCPSVPGGALWIKHRKSNGLYFWTLYGHVMNPVYTSLSPGQIIPSGAKVAEVAHFDPCCPSGGDCPHLHFGIWDGDPYRSNQWGYGPQGSFTNPITFMESTDPWPEDGTTQTTWLFNTNGNLGGWTLVNVDAFDVSNDILTINPGNDPQLRSPLLSRSPSSINYMKIGMKNKGGDENGTLFFSSPEYGYSDSRKATYSNPNNGIYNWITIRLNNIVNWGDASNIDHIRIDPVNNGIPVNGNDDVLIDYIFLRHDGTNPDIPTITSISPSGWTNDPISVSFQANDPHDVNPVGPDVYGSGVQNFYYRVDPHSDVAKNPDSFDDRSGLASATVTFQPSDLNQGQNSFHVYAHDKTDHYGTNAIGTLYFDSGAPNAPSGLTVTPICNNVNSFAFSWNPVVDPVSGTAGYYWHVNTGSETFTSAASLPAGAYATQGGPNTFYVRCVDQAGNSSGTSQTTFSYNVGSCGPCPPWPPCSMLLADGSEPLLLSLDQHTTQEWAAGQPATDIIKPGFTYAISFWYQTSSNSPFGWIMGGETPASNTEWKAIRVNNPVVDDTWHWFLSAPFEVTGEQLKSYPNLVLDVGQGVQVEVREVQLYEAPKGVSQDVGARTPSLEGGR
jgi:hypothetical protein